MRKGKSVIGQPVYSVADGVKVESVKDLVLEDGDDGVVALLLSEGGLLSTSTVVPFASVVRFGPSAVMVDDRMSVIPAASDPRVTEILDRRGTLLGKRVMTSEGEDLGTIADMYFDEATGRITGYQVSGGLIGDATRGSSYLPFDQIETIGPDAVVTTGAARDQVSTQDGGLRTVEQDNNNQEGGDPDASLVGARATADVTHRDGSIVVASGQLISQQMVERARTDDDLDRLYGAAGIIRPGTGADVTGEAVSKAVDTASDLWGRFTTKVSEMTDAAGQRLDAQQTKARLDAINDAIGRPVTKVFLDRDDSVLLDLGDLVTHQAVQRADDAGLLDSLLASVYRADQVTFTREEMRAEIAGDSTVDKAAGGATVIADLEARLDGGGAQHEDGPESEPASPERQPAGQGQPSKSGQSIGQRPTAGDDAARGKSSGSPAPVGRS